MRRSAALVSLVALGSGCASSLDDPTPRVSSPRVLAISVEPAEVAPNASARFTALYADASGALSIAPLEWTACTARKPLAELGPVSEKCLDKGQLDSHLAIGVGRSVVGRVPRETCRLFGPNPPPSIPGEPNQRPVDPDTTGGFYQPIVAFRSDGGADPTLFQVRIACGASSGSSEAVIAYGARYRTNVNPIATSLTLDDAVDVPADGEGQAPTIALGSTHALRLRWPSCPDVGVCGDGICGDDESVSSCTGDCTTPFGCEGAEHYVMIDPSSAELVRRRESLSVSWYSTAGEFDEARTGRASDDLETHAENVFTAPTSPGEVVLFAVLRDERGGTSFRSYRVFVGP